MDSDTQKRRIGILTIRHLMTMTTGHDRDTFRPVLNGARSVEAFLQEPLDFDPGTHFLYNNGVPHILGMAVERAAGMNYIEYLRPRLLEPLEIFCTVEKTEKGELEGSRTVCTAEGFAKLTLFYLQEGMWNGQAAAGSRTGSGSRIVSGTFRSMQLHFLHARRPVRRVWIPGVAEYERRLSPRWRPQPVRLRLPGEESGHRVQRHRGGQRPDSAHPLGDDCIRRLQRRMRRRLPAKAIKR